jgi:hypothetical protein
MVWWTSIHRPSKKVEQSQAKEPAVEQEQPSRQGVTS